MAIRGFEVGPLRGLTKAKAEELPNLVAIARPNGAGKSALLELLWSNRQALLEEGTTALYVGPHRTWRGTQLTDAAVRSLTLDFEDVLKLDSLPGFQVPLGNLHWLAGLSRIGSSADDAHALVKAAIIRIHNRVQTVVTKEFYRQGTQIAPGSVPDLMGPLETLIETLLPHLRWQGVEDSDPANIRVLIKSTEMSEEASPFDIDNLSSGEKAAIALFLPIVERQVRSLVEEDEELSTDTVPLTFLIDEPEIHLHPLLQLNVLAYMRDLSERDQVQFIFTTQSPALLDALEPGELFQLNPASLSPENQFVRLSDSLEHLEAARRITGSTHLLTRSKPIVFIEGERDAGTAATDERLVKLLAPETRHWALVASHGKSQVIKAVRDLQATRLNLPGSPVFGLVDSDQAEDDPLDTVIAWPVAMVENLLLDADAIFSVLEPQGGHGLTSAAKVASVLKSASEAIRDEEVRLRVEATLPKQYLRIEGDDLTKIEEKATKLFEEYLQRLKAIDVTDLKAQAELDVSTIENEGKALERFHGKKLLRTFYDDQKIASLGLGWSAFVLQVANEAAKRDRCAQLTRSSVRKIQLYFPKEVTSVLEAAAAVVPKDLLERAQRHRELWVKGEPELDGREALRSELLELSRSIRDSGDEETAAALLDSAVGIRLGD